MITGLVIGSGGERISGIWDDYAFMALNLEKVVFFHCVGDEQTAFETIDKRYVVMNVPFADVCEAFREVTAINATR